MRKRIIFIEFAFLLLIAYSCNTRRSSTKCYILEEDTVDRKCEVYDSLGILKEVYHMKDSMVHGLDIVFYSTGKKAMEGNWYKGKKADWFKYYGDDGKLQVLRQYIPVNDPENWNNDAAYLNQVIHFDGKGDTVKNGSFFMQLYSVGDTIHNGDTYAFKITLVAPLFKEMTVILCDLDDKYALLPNAICDTFGVENYQRTFSPKEYHSGENIIRGKIVNFENYTDSIGNSKQHVAEIYFTNRFYVK